MKILLYPMQDWGHVGVVAGRGHEVKIVETRDQLFPPLPIVLKMFIGQYQVDWGALTAGGMVTSIPLVVFFMLVQRYLIAGLTAGVVKQ